MKFDEYMHDSMKEIAQDVQPDPRMRARVMNAVQIERTKSRPRRMRFAVVAAAMVCVLIGGAFAAGPIVALTSSTNANDLPVDAIDADGNTVYSYQEFYASYRDGATQPFMTVIKSENDSDEGVSDSTIVDTREVNGITMTYREIPTILLPGSGEEMPTDEEQAAADRGEIFISYGTTTREDGMYHTIDWDEDGLHYAIASNDGDWTADDFFAAAEDVLNTEK